MTVDEFKKKVLPLQNKIFRFAKRLLNIQVEAEDITQDVFIKLWTKKEEISNYKSVEALAMKMTRNMCLDRIKSHKRKNVEFGKDDFITTSNPYKDAEIADSMSLMNAIIKKLPDQQKEIVQLREIEGYEFDEISEITGMNINAIRVNLSRARQKIKQELKKAFDYGLKTN